jgi:hypothetical protein
MPGTNLFLTGASSALQIVGVNSFMAGVPFPNAIIGNYIDFFQQE